MNANLIGEGAQAIEPSTLCAGLDFRSGDVQNIRGHKSQHKCNFAYGQMHFYSATKISCAINIPTMEETRQITLAFLGAAQKAAGVKDLTSLARKAGVASTTLTRYASDTPTTHDLSLRTLRKVSSVSGVPVPSALTAMAAPLDIDELLTGLLRAWKRAGTNAREQDFVTVGRELYQLAGGDETIDFEKEAVYRLLELKDRAGS